MRAVRNMSEFGGSFTGCAAVLARSRSAAGHRTARQPVTQPARQVGTQPARQEVTEPARQPATRLSGRKRRNASRSSMNPADVRSTPATLQPVRSGRAGSRRADSRRAGSRSVQSDGSAGRTVSAPDAYYDGLPRIPYSACFIWSRIEEWPNLGLFPAWPGSLRRGLASYPAVLYRPRPVRRHDHPVGGSKSALRCTTDWRAEYCFCKQRRAGSCPSICKRDKKKSDGQWMDQ